MNRSTHVMAAFSLYVLAACAPSPNGPTEIVPDPATGAASGVSSSGYSTSVGSGGSAGAGGDGGAPDMGAPGDGGGHVSSSGTRLKVTRYAGVDGSSFVRAEAFDSALGFACHFLQAVDGTTRCFPTTYMHTYYVDAACSVPIGVSGECQRGSEDHATLLGDALANQCPPRTHRAFRMSDTPTPFSVAYINTGEACVELRYSTPIMLREMTEIPAVDLARVDIEVDAP